MKKTFTTPSGGKYTREVKSKSPKKKEKTTTGGKGVMHKGYTYTNKKGTTITVKAHIEHPKGGKAKPRKK